MNKEKKKLPSHLQYDTVSPATKLLEKRRKMYEVHEAFEAQKKEFIVQEEQFKRQEEKIRLVDMDIQENLIKFCKFLQENETKKKRAEQRIQEEKTLQSSKQAEIQLLTDKIDELQDEQKRLDRKMMALKKYEDYLESILKAYPDQYHDLQSILDRYVTLTSSNKKLVDEHQAMEKEYENLKQKSTQYEKERNHEILQLNNDIKELQQKLEEKITEKNQLQGVVEASSNEASSKNLSLGRILMAIDNLYNRCQEGTQKIKHEFEEPVQDKKEEKKSKQKEDKKKQKQKQVEQQQIALEDNYEVKSQQAAQKLKIIALYMNDFKNIIAGCRLDQQRALEQKKNK